MWSKMAKTKRHKATFIEYHDLNICNMYNDISPVKVRAQNTSNAISPVYTSRKIKVKIQVTEEKPPLLINNVYRFQCYLYNTGYVGYTCRHFHQRIEEH